MVKSTIVRPELSRCRHEAFLGSSEVGSQITVGSVVRSCITPPSVRGKVALAALREDKAEEDENRSNSGTSVQGGTEDVVVSCPPTGAILLDEVVEDETTQSPRGEVDTGGRRHETGTGEDDGRVDLAHERARELPG